ncbi:truncated FRIGIDA-like protein 1 [Tasmannia lanceolata]|uniref:truncated FRIGIDA-like protein 1 n=1 Tax=Tasmannia lanceolata TaxID=3420 RepID=UPI0040643808
MVSSTKSISAAIKSIPSKKESLRKAFEEVQSHPSSLTSFTLQWKDLETHIDSMSKSVQSRFKELESKEKQNPLVKKSEKSDNVAKKPEESSSEAKPKLELKSFCVKMDGKGLREFIIENWKELSLLQNEIVSALRSASDPAKLVLDAMNGFFSSNPKSRDEKERELFSAFRHTCILLLDCLSMISPEIKNSVKERAKKLAIEWKGMISPRREDRLKVWVFFQFLASYRLVSVFDAVELLDLTAFIARWKETIDFIRTHGLADKIPDFVQKLVIKGKQLDAVYFVYAFELVNKFPPVPLLKTYLKESEKVAEEIRKRGKYTTRSENEAKDKEIAALKGVITCIEEHSLESEFSSENLEKRISQLEKQKAEKNRGARLHVLKPQQHPPNKKPRPVVPTTAAVPHSDPQATINKQQPQPSGLLVNSVPSYLGSAGPYGLAGPGMLYDCSGPSFLGSSLDFGANHIPSLSEQYSSEHLLGTSLYDKRLVYSSLPLSGGLPYRPPYLP